MQAEPVCSAAELSGLLQSRCNIKACLKRQIEISWVRSHGCQLRQLAAACRCVQRSTYTAWSERL